MHLVSIPTVLRWTITLIISACQVYANTAVASPSNNYAPEPFGTPGLALHLDQPISDRDVPFRRRALACEPSYIACGNPNQPSVCCPTGSRCTADNAAQPACCPTGALCTGTLGHFASATSASSGYLTMSTDARTGARSTFSSQSTATVTVTLPSPGIRPTSDPPYTFAPIPTIFANPGQCSSFYTACEITYASCTAALGMQCGFAQGGTIAGLSITEACVSDFGGRASAISVCSTLSEQACRGLHVTQCSLVGTAKANEAGEQAGQAAYVVKVGAGFLVGLLGAAVA